MYGILKTKKKFLLTTVFVVCVIFVTIWKDSGSEFGSQKTIDDCKLERTGKVECVCRKSVSYKAFKPALKRFNMPLPMAMTFSINTTWDGKPINHLPVTISMEPDRCNNLVVVVSGPFFNDPPNPGGTPGQPFPQLWDYEVAEAFFLNDQNDYLEVELSPHGQHLLLLLHGRRQSFKDQLPLDYTAKINHDRWTGRAVIPASYFPPKVTKFNAYAIHGSGANRTYESLYPVPTGKYTDPDFHKLEYFQPIDFRNILGNWSPTYTSAEWKPYYPVIG